MANLQAAKCKGAAIAAVLVLWSARLAAARVAAAQDSAPIRVACLGDSITAGEGSGVKGPEAAHFSYPAVLDAILGTPYEVRGFGAGGHALRADAPRVFATSETAAGAVEFAPGIAIVVLGTNDSSIQEEYGGYGQDVDGLVARLRAANPEVAVWLSSPPQMFPQRAGLKPERRANLEQRQPRLNALTEKLCAVAAERDGVTFIDVRDVLRPGDVTDGVHLNPIGAERLAYRYAEAIEGEPIARTLTPVPSNEYRGKAAGWGGGTWRDAYASLKALGEEARKGAPVDVLFLGDSITQGLTGHEQRWSKSGGTRVFDKFHGQRRAVSVGLSGDRTEHILYRLEDGSLDGFRPRTIVLQVGINNVNAAGHSGYWTYHGIAGVVRALEARFPRAHILVSGPFPGGVKADSEVRREIAGVHALLGHAEFGPLVDVLNLEGLFVGPDGELLETMSKDGIHITSLGESQWMEALEPYLVKPRVTVESRQMSLVLARDVTVQVDTLLGLRSLSVHGVSVAAPDSDGKDWMLDGSPTGMRVKNYVVRGGSVRLNLEFDLKSWEADASQRAKTVPNADDMAETWRLASLGDARGYDRRLTKKSQGASLGEYWTITTRRERSPLAWEVKSRPVKDFYGYSTVSSSGLTYNVARIELESGTEDAIEGWWFRSGVHLMSQAVNMGANPTLREVVLLEPPGTEPIPLTEVIREYVTMPQDRRTLLDK